MRWNKKRHNEPLLNRKLNHLRSKSQLLICSMITEPSALENNLGVRFAAPKTSPYVKRVGSTVVVRHAHARHTPPNSICFLQDRCQSCSQSLLTSYGENARRKRRLWKGPILRWFWLVIRNAIQYNKSAICGLLQPVPFVFVEHAP